MPSRFENALRTVWKYLALAAGILVSGFVMLVEPAKAKRGASSSMPVSLKVTQGCSAGSRLLDQDDLRKKVRVPCNRKANFRRRILRPKDGTKQTRSIPFRKSASKRNVTRLEAGLRVGRAMPVSVKRRFFDRGDEPIISIDF